METTMFAAAMLADIDSIIGVIFVIFWIVAWVLKLIAGQSQKSPPVANRPKPAARQRDEKLQDEIDIFIQEVSPKKPVRRPPPTSRPPVPVKPASKRPALQQASAPSLPSRAESPRKKPGQALSDRHIATGEKMGEGVQQHLKQHMSERVTRESAAFLSDNVDQSVARHLGQPAAQALAAPPAKVPVPSGASLAETLRSPANLRQAMIASLILGPPPARRRSLGRESL